MRWYKQYLRKKEQNKAAAKRRYSRKKAKDE